MALTNQLSAIGTAIRAKTGGTELFTLDEMPSAIGSITGGVSTNGMHQPAAIVRSSTNSYDVTNYVSSDRYNFFWLFLAYAPSGSDTYKRYLYTCKTLGEIITTPSADSAGIKYSHTTGTLSNSLTLQVKDIPFTFQNGILTFTSGVVGEKAILIY